MCNNTKQSGCTKICEPIVRKRTQQWRSKNIQNTIETIAAERLSAWEFIVLDGVVEIQLHPDDQPYTLPAGTSESFAFPRDSYYNPIYNATLIVINATNATVRFKYLD